MICNNCLIEVDKLEYHHDPPRHRIFKQNSSKYFIDKDGEKKLVIFHRHNRRVCKKCHKKLDKEWRKESKKND